MKRNTINLHNVAHGDMKLGKLKKGRDHIVDNENRRKQNLHIYIYCFTNKEWVITKAGGPHPEWVTKAGGPHPEWVIKAGGPYPE